jgi:ABC-type transport system involved in cytochrome c biogenesis permease subunit
MFLFNTSARLSDKLRVFYRLDDLDLVLYFLFHTANATLALGISCGLFPIYGTKEAIIFACVWTGVCIFLTNAVNQIIFLRTSHPHFAWNKIKHSDYLAKMNYHLDVLKHN